MTYDDDIYALSETGFHDLPPVWQAWITRLLMWLRLSGPDGLAGLKHIGGMDPLHRDADWDYDILFESDVISPEEQALWDAFPPRRLNARETGLITATYGFVHLEDLIARMIHVGQKALATLKAGHASGLKKRPDYSRLSLPFRIEPISNQFCVEPSVHGIFCEIIRTVSRTHAYIIPP